MKAWLTQQYQQSASLQRILNWYQACTVREQVLLKVACVFLIAVVLFYWVLAPLQMHKAEAQQRVHDAQQQYQLLQLNAQKLFESRVVSQFQERNVNELRRVLSQASSAAQMTADRIQIDGDSRLQVWASDVSFAVVAKWLSNLAQQQVGISNLQLERVSEGRVNLRITLD